MNGGSVNRRYAHLAPMTTSLGLGGCCNHGEPRKGGDRVDGRCTLSPGRDRDARYVPTIFMRRAGAVLQRRVSDSIAIMRGA